jgi:hypothetical protein
LTLRADPRDPAPREKQVPLVAGAPRACHAGFATPDLPRRICQQYLVRCREWNRGETEPGFMRFPRLRLSVVFPPDRIPQEGDEGMRGDAGVWIMRISILRPKSIARADNMPSAAMPANGPVAGLVEGPVLRSGGRATMRRLIAGLALVAGLSLLALAVPAAAAAAAGSAERPAAADQAGHHATAATDLSARRYHRRYHRHRYYRPYRYYRPHYYRYPRRHYYRPYYGYRPYYQPYYNSYPSYFAPFPFAPFFPF